MGQRKRPTRCKDCGATADGELVISWRGLCVDCAVERGTQPARELQAREGPAYDAWLASMQRVGERAAQQR